MPKLRVGRSIGHGGAGKSAPAIDGHKYPSLPLPVNGHRLTPSDQPQMN
jgi:hypothetical protein